LLEWREKSSTFFFSRVSRSLFADDGVQKPGLLLVSWCPRHLKSFGEQCELEVKGGFGSSWETLETNCGTQNSAMSSRDATSRHKRVSTPGKVQGTRQRSEANPPKAI
jgi:hypothetical protein